MSNQVEDRPMVCTYCGAGPQRGRHSTYVDHIQNEQVTDIEWVCGRCGSRFFSGELSRIPLQAETHEDG